MTSANFQATCNKLHLDALMVSRADPAWLIPGTWVWQQPTLYADGAVRLIACPKP